MNARLKSARRLRAKHLLAGFTLLETIIVVMVLGILSVSAAPKFFNASQLTLEAQARNLASDLQRTQLLATTRGNTFYFCTNANGYVAQPSNNCPTSVPSQISNNQPVAVILDKQATLSVTLVTPPTPATLSFNSLGQPSTAGSFQLLSSPVGSGSITVTVAAVTGLVSLSSP